MSALGSARAHYEVMHHRLLAQMDAVRAEVAVLQEMDDHGWRSDEEGPGVLM